MDHCVSFFFWRNIFKKLVKRAFKHGANAGQNIDVQPGHFIAAITVDLRALHFRAMAQLIFADAFRLNQFVQFDSNCAVICHISASFVLFCGKRSNCFV